MTSNGRGAESRRHAIVETVRREGFVTIETLTERFAVTPQTIRRDLNDLAAAGVLNRHHGGAAPGSSVENIAYASRQVLNPEAKARIAAAVAAQIPDHASLCLNIGTTTEAVARALMGHAGLTVITNNLHVASHMATKADFQVIVAGGLVRARDLGIVGDAAIDLIRQFKVDIAVIGISAIDTDGTLLDFDPREVRVAQAIIAHARRVYLAADHTKFGRPAVARLGTLAEIDTLFTDRAPPEGVAGVLEAGGARLVVAG